MLVLSIHRLDREPRCPWDLEHHGNLVITTVYSCLCTKRKDICIAFQCTLIPVDTIGSLSKVFRLL